MYRFPTAQYPWGRTLGQDAEAAAAPVVTQYKGVPGFVETAAVLGVSAAAAWVGIRAGMKEKGLPQVAGYVGGIGAGLIGILYLAGQTKVVTGLPKIQVVKA